MARHFAMIALGILALSLLAFGCCKKENPFEAKGKGEVVASINGSNIYMDDYKDRMEKQSPYIRSRYDSLEKKKEFLDNMIRFELLAQEAIKKGYDKDPEVLRAAKQVMTQKLMTEEFDAKLKEDQVPEADKQKYYEEHKSEYNKPAMRRASHILIKVAEGADAKTWAAAKTKADKALKEAKAAKADDPNAFRDLVAKYSDDENNKTRGGDLGYFSSTEEGGPMAKEFSDAVFAVAAVNDFAGPVKTKLGWHVIRLTGIRDKIERSYEQVKGQIEHRLFKDLRTKKYDEFLANLQKAAKITINDKALNAYTPATAAPGDAPQPGQPDQPGQPQLAPMPGQPMGHPGVKLSPVPTPAPAGAKAN